MTPNTSHSLERRLERSTKWKLKRADSWREAMKLARNFFYHRTFSYSCLRDPPLWGQASFFIAETCYHLLLRSSFSLVYKTDMDKIAYPLPNKVLMEGILV